jgi:hypothetical protein
MTGQAFCKFSLSIHIEYTILIEYDYVHLARFFHYFYFHA